MTLTIGGTGTRRQHSRLREGRELLALVAEQLAQLPACCLLLADLGLQALDLAAQALQRCLLLGIEGR